MKKCLFLVWMMALSLSMFAKDYTSEQLDLRKNIMSFLREEGYVPEIDSDGDILFKSEGKKYFVIISDVNTSPMYLVFFHGYTYDDTYTKSRVERAVKEINLYKGLKLLAADESYSFRFEMFLVNADHFRYTFYKQLSIMKDAEQEFKELVEKMK